MIYLPNLTDYNCIVVQSEDIIRAYNNVPNSPGTYNYRDYYINSSYIYRDGQQTFSNYSIYPICLSSSQLTDNFYYRLDFDKICVTFFVFFIVSILVARFTIRSFFRGWFR